MAIEVVKAGSEIRDMFLSRMAESFSAEAVQRKAQCWDWLFSRRVGEGDASAFALLAMRNEVMLGGCIMFPSLYRYLGKDYLVYSPYGTNITPTARGAGLPLLKYMYTLPYLMLGIPIDDQLARVNERFGTIDTLRFHSFKVLRGGRALARSKPWVAPLSGVGDMLWRAWESKGALTGPRLARDESITAETSFGPDYLAFWERARENRPFILVRDAEFMTWRYLRMPLQPYEVLFLRRNGAVIGYVVVATRLDEANVMGQVTDLLTVDDDERSVALLLAAAGKRLAAHGAAIAAFGFAENAALEAAGRKVGFARIKVTRPVQIYHKDPVIYQQLKDKVAPIYMTRGDQDQDF